MESDLANVAQTPVFTLEIARQRLERYVEDRERTARYSRGQSDADDITVPIFRAMLDHGPSEGVANTVHWILSPTVSLPAIVLFTELQCMGPGCDDETLFHRAYFLRRFLVHACI